MIKTASLIDVRVHLVLVVTLPVAPSFKINDLFHRKMPPLWFVVIRSLASKLKHWDRGNFILHLPILLGAVRT